MRNILLTYTPFLNNLTSLVQILLFFNNDVILVYALGWVIDVFIFSDISDISLLSDNCPVILGRLDMIYELTMARYLETLTLEVGVLEHEPKSVVLGLWSEVDNLNHLATHVPF
jgi:hypothetical protein